MPCHAIIYMKIKHILKNVNHLRKVPDTYIFSQVDINTIKTLSHTIGLRKEDTLEAFKRMRYYEELFYISRIFYDAQHWFDYKTFMNPLGAHGMIIIGYIINTLAYALLRNKIF